MSDDRLAALVSGVQMGQFASVGALGALCDNAVLVALKLGAGVAPIVAKAAGAETAIVVMFLANEHWTFADAGDAGRRAFLGRLARSHLVRAAGVCIQLAVYWVLTERVTVSLVVLGTDLWFLAASPIAIGAAMGVNYVAESLFTWRIAGG
ncbi:MAG: GtrA family protein [Haloferacaceae archaeon]